MTDIPSRPREECGTSPIRCTGTNYSDSGNATFLLNLHDSSAEATISVEGGTFTNYNPAESNSENPSVSFIAEGYESTETSTGVWEVVASTAE